ncbi:MAG: SapC family protein [Beijerinckiaceae bacterium]|nr:SapC family protein [Beijerinckiaceae bacterium]
MLPLFYTDVTAVERDRDRARKISFGAERFGFCAKSHLSPCLATEFAAGAREYPIVFLKENDKHTPVFMFGLRPGQNLMVSPEGGWLGSYLPRYLARFPFIIAEIPGTRMILGVDASAKHDENGLALFEESGEPSPFLDAMLKLSDAYALDARASEAYVARLAELDLFRPITVEVNTDGKSYGWTDLFAVDEAKLNALPDEALLSMARSGYLAATYSHLLSLQAFRALREAETRLAQTQAAPAS